MHTCLVDEWKQFARRGHALLSKVVGTQGFSDCAVPGALVRLPADEDAVPAVVVVWLQHQRVSLSPHEFKQVNLLPAVSRLRMLNPARPRHRPPNCLLLRI